MCECALGLSGVQFVYVAVSLTTGQLLASCTSTRLVIVVSANHQDSTESLALGICWPH